MGFSTLNRRRGLLSPSVVCDVCSMPIERADEGVVYWPPAFEDRPVPIEIAHRNPDCAAGQRRRHEQRWLWTPLEGFLSDLLHNVQFHPEDALDTARMMRLEDR